jgi:hypothetical protein
MIAAGFLATGAFAIIAAVAITSGGGGDGSVSSNTPAATQPAVSPSGVPFVPADADGEAIVALARKSIEVLPQGQWPSLYTDFVAEFQARCTPETFAQAGVDSATNLGADLPLLAYKAMQDVTITGDTAQGTIIGQVTGKSEYLVSAYFAKENGVWKIAPAPDTQGCEAFSVLS